MPRAGTDAPGLLALVLGLLIALLGLAACAAPQADDRLDIGGRPAVLRVPGQFPSIQKAMDSAQSGDMVLVSPGVYRESVAIRTPRIVLRGTDRSKVVLDGEFKRINGITVTGAASVVENLTVRNYLANGLLFTGVTDKALQGAGAGGGANYDPLDTAKFPALRGFRASYVTAYDNALYGIYAFDARDGVIENSYGSGQADSGIYVGQCNPCNTIVRSNLAEHNAVGIEVTNASKDLYLLGNTIRRNRVGLTVLSNNLEALGPQHNAVFVGNTISDNNDDRSPEQADGGFGIGVGIGGGTHNRFERNRVEGNHASAFVLQDVQGYPVVGNEIKGNTVDDGQLGLVMTANRVQGNCYSGNGHGPTSPDPLPRALTACPGRDTAIPVPGRLPTIATVPPGVSFRDVPSPPAQPGKRDAAHEPARPALRLPGRVDLAAYRLPESRR
ncbi:right-handed parallel beta-helix repeat-containing protein [Streptomyces sp. AK02-04a]|uniref:right-handed parallel beta-helix repeat-containing protein n=1 Tax=Streptomyces sp. AK02-04a TaxID=3028649 RepID=UPI0029B296ED|nr:right-handed parallel beta-helix repeat-containing protein [Streptomyces sp. AK02-04a]MDX3763603.1 right-handed parallel beta-helix repeat-containing protein [Streptomyces sp. AK02-04a]